MKMFRIFLYTIWAFSLACGVRTGNPGKPTSETNISLQMQISNQSSPDDEITIHLNEIWFENSATETTEKVALAETQSIASGAIQAVFSSKAISNGVYDKMRLILREERPAQYRESGSNQTFELAIAPYGYYGLKSGLRKSKLVQDQSDLVQIVLDLGQSTINIGDSNSKNIRLFANFGQQIVAYDQLDAKVKDYFGDQISYSYGFNPDVDSSSVNLDNAEESAVVDIDVELLSAAKLCIYALGASQDSLCSNASITAPISVVNHEMELPIENGSYVFVLYDGTGNSLLSHQFTISNNEDYKIDVDDDGSIRN